MSAGNVFDDATTSDIIAIVRQWRAGTLLSPGDLSRAPAVPHQPLLPFFTNDSGEAIPPYACMQITGTSEIGKRNYLKVKKPVDTDGTAGAFIFNGHREVAIGKEGLAQTGPVVRGYKNTGTVTGGDKWIPVSGQWYIAKGEGQFICCGEDAVLTNVVKVVANGAGGGRPGIFQRRFTGRDSANTGKWDNSFATHSGWIHMSSYAGLAAPAVGITVVPDTTVGAPADAELLQFATPGDYRITVQWQVGVVASNKQPLQTGCNVTDLISGAEGEEGARLFSSEPAAALGSLGARTIIDVRAIRTTVSNLKIRVAIWAVEGTGTVPIPEGSVTVERCT